jgi:hypothetical protein
VTRALGLLLCLLSLLVCVSPPAHAAWPTSSTTNVPLCTVYGDQYGPTMVQDGAGGAIVAWLDFRNGTTPHVYAQRISAAGAPQWTSGGVAVCTAGGGQQNLNIAPDGAGGALLVWVDHRDDFSDDVYAQRIAGSDGGSLWDADGKQLGHVANPDSWEHPCIMSDGAGGAIVVWADGLWGWNPGGNLHAQRLGAADGQAMWADPVVSTTSGGRHPAIAPDGSNGVIIAWEDLAREGHIYAQRLDGGNGDGMWDLDGARVCDADTNSHEPAIASDGAGGVVIAWEDHRGERRGFSGLSGVYSQRLDSEGGRKWDPDGVPVYLAGASDAGSLAMVMVDHAGAIVWWADSRGLYAQRLNVSGVPQWTANGVPLRTNPAIENEIDHLYPLVVSDGSHGIIGTWWEKRGANYDIYAQRVDVGGHVNYWGVDGVAVCKASGDQYFPVLVPDGFGGAIIAWQDVRGGSWDIYAQQVNSLGRLGDQQSDVPGGPVAGVWLGSPLPNPATNGTRVSYALPQTARVSLGVYDLQGRRVQRLLDGVLPAGAGSVPWNGRDESGSLAPSGLYFVRLETGGEVLTRRLTAIH